MKKWCIRFRINEYLKGSDNVVNCFLGNIPYNAIYYFFGYKCKIWMKWNVKHQTFFTDQWITVDTWNPIFSAAVCEPGQLTFVSRNGGQVLLRNGYQYYKKRMYKSGIMVWECRYRKQRRCPGLVNVQVSFFLRKIIKHHRHSRIIVQISR